MTEQASLLTDPSQRLEAAFRAIHVQCMQGLAFVNPALRVEAIGFAPWKHYWLGVMLTPWSMNLLLTPHDPAAWRPLPAGAKRRYAFPAGTFDFIGAVDARVGEYLTCSLFSPVPEFADHDTAREAARVAREALFDAAHAEGAEPAEARDRSPSARVAAGLATPMSRRDLLRGRWRDHEPGR
ncbi:MAG: [NiFe]-hydrogenase assembly chaperone HybE [Burkholderiales bacterium]